MSETKPSSAARSLIRIAIVFIVVFDLAFLWQKAARAFESELGGHPDEATHCVSGIFMRDAAVAAWNYARGGFQQPPVELARNYTREFASHYPRVAIGSMPPGFHLLEGAWTLAFGTSRLSFLVLMAFLAGVTGTVIFEAVRRHSGMWAASAAALLWMCAPFVREQYQVIMPEMLAGLTMLGATLAWGRYMDEGRKRDALWFTLLTAAAILTKSTGLALIGMCILSLLLSGTWRVLARPSFWAAILLIAGVGGIWVWTLRQRMLGINGWEAVQPNLPFTNEAAPFYGVELAYSLGFGIAAFAAIGLLANLRKSGTWAAVAAMVISVWSFHVLVPSTLEARHLLPATTGLIMLATAGVFAIARYRRVATPDEAVQGRRERLWVVLLVLVAVPQMAVRIVPKSFDGFTGVALELLGSAPPKSRVLVSSDRLGEGMFIAEIAMRDARPNFMIERSTVNLLEPKSRIVEGRQARPRFGDDASVLDYLAREKIDYVLVDRAIPESTRTPYHEQLQRVVENNAGIFAPPVESPVRRHDEDLFPPLRLHRVVRERLR